VTGHTTVGEPGADRERRHHVERRTPTPRRAVQDRRQESRRRHHVLVEVERRHLPDRRREQRRGEYDRRSRIGRRYTDRRRETPGAYSPNDTAQIRAMLGIRSGAVTCPLCRARLPVDGPETVHGTEIWQVYCADCNRMALITRSRSARILIVDDEGIVRDALGILLEQAGHAVVEAASGQEALERFRETPADVVILDMFMPDMDGVDVTRRLLREFPDARVIAMAGKPRHGLPDPLATVKQLGVVQIIRKPFPPTALLRILDEVLAP